MAKRKLNLKMLIRHTKPYQNLIILCVFFQLGIAFLQIFQLHLLQTAIDVYVLRADFLGLLKNVLLIYLFVLGLLLLFSFLRIYLTSYIGQNVMLDLRMKIFAHLQTMPLAFFDRTPIGKLLTVATNDVQHLQPVATEQFTSILGNVFLFLGIVGYLFYQNYQLALIFYVLILGFGIFLVWINRKAAKATRESRSWFGKINAFLQENITGISLIKLFRQEKKQNEKLYYFNKSYADTSIRSLSYLNLTPSVTAIFRAAVMSLILGYGGRKVLQGTLSLGSLLVFIGSMGLFFALIERTVKANKVLQTAWVSLERILGFLDTKSELESPQGKVKLPDFKDKIEFNDVWFAYDNNNFVLNNFNLKIKKGEQIGIVGHTGAGKTSIVNLLARFYEMNKGQILIDGVNIQNINKGKLRSLIGIVPQDPFLFSGSIEDNIKLRNSEIDSQQVQQAAVYVGADKFISQLPHGYKEKVQELGSRLSTGQKQLISFARACLFNPQIIVLDEATANVDAETTNEIKNILKILKGQRTVIVIAHHLSTVRNADRILVLHMGKMREMGTHSQLMKKKGIYYNLCLLQELEDRLTHITKLVTKLTEIVGYARLHYVKNAQLARKIGERFNLSKRQLEQLETATLIYDVGKMRIPVNILTKPGSLTKAEFETIKKHVIYSKNVAEKLEDFEDIARIVCYHHERWDGKGYLEGLKGEAIPLESRIIAIVDAYQAMISDKPYLKALSVEQAQNELIKNAGKQFDPQIVEIFIKILKEET
ncbi:ABC transporter transmembrane domain-containing protein [Candidatus Omnitrophota bacterium]